MTHTTRSFKSGSVVDVRLLETFTSSQTLRDEMIDKILDMHIDLQ